MARTPKAPAAGSKTVIEGGAEEVKPKKKMVTPQLFFQQVAAEFQKVTWTTRNETMISTIMVIILVIIMALFFLFIDFVLRFGVSALLSINS